MDYPKRITLLGVPIDALTRTAAVAKAEALLAEPRGHLVTTPNPEMLVLADRDSAFKAVLAKADLALPDGVGLLHAARRLGTPIPERISGTDFVDALAALAVPKGASMFLLGGQTKDVAQRAAAEMQKNHPGLNIAGAESGGLIQLKGGGGWDMDPALLQRIQAAAPTMLLVALGHGKQERWITDHLSQLPSVRLAIGIGGAFDFIAGDVKRAPRWMRDAGLEWLWRLITQPWRWHRIWTAVVVFPLLVLRRKN